MLKPLKTEPSGWTVWLKTQDKDRFLSSKPQLLTGWFIWDQTFCDLWWPHFESSHHWWSQIRVVATPCLPPLIALAETRGLWSPSWVTLCIATQISNSKSVTSQIYSRTPGNGLHLIWIWLWIVRVLEFSAPDCINFTSYNSEVKN